MAQRSPTAKGFRTIIRTPSLWLAEIAWRWSFGILAGLLLFLAVCEFLASLKLSNADVLLLQADNPILNAAVLGKLLQDGAPRLLRIAAVLLPAFAGLWVFASALGRTATLKVILPNAGVRLQTMFGLSLLRAALSVAALAALVGAAREAILVQGDAATAILIIAAVAAVFVWTVLNWLLSLAAVCAGGNDTFDAIAGALRLSRLRAAAFAAAGAWFGLMHTVAAAGAFTAALFALGLLTLSVWLAAVVLVLVIAVYLAVVDLFYIARLAAYAVIAEDSELPSDPVAVPQAAIH